MGSQARPVFFCTRPNGTLTPLIAMDDLPTHITVRGVSRTIAPGETQGMISCGVAVPRPQPWIVDAPSSTAQNANMSDATEIADVLAKILDEELLPNSLRAQAQDALVRYTNSIQQAANKPQKEYCSYWIRHGECDYAQQGCLFKHEMPRDPVLLARLGLRDIPKWYREQYGVPSIHEDAYGNYRPQLAIAEQPARQAIQYNVPNQGVVARNGNVNSNNNAQYRGPNGRYRSPRGVGYPNRGRANYWQRNGSRMNISQASTVGTPASGSPDFSDQSWIDTAGVTGTKNLKLEQSDPQEDGGVLLPVQHVSYKNEPIGRLTGGPTYRTKSRRPWVKEHDGKHPSPDASPVGADEVNAPAKGSVNIQATDAKDVKTTTAINIQAANAKDVKTATAVNVQAIDATKVEAATVMNVQTAHANNFETATAVKTPTPDTYTDSSAASVVCSTTGAHDNSTVTSVSSTFPDLIDYATLTAVRAPPFNQDGVRQLPVSAIAEMARNSDPIIGKANMALWTPIGEPVRRLPYFGHLGFSNGSEFGW